MNRTIGVLGGSFDPVHAGHVELARRALAQVPCDEVWFLPAARAVHKPHGAVASVADRVAMLERAIAGLPGLVICDAELEAGAARRSLHTLQELHQRWPEYEWRFLLGEDSFGDLEAWYRPAELLRLAPAVVAPRPGSTGPRPSGYSGQPVRWLQGAPIDLDSTSLRAALAQGEEPAGLDPAVLDYIRAHGLYREQDA